MQRSAVVAHHGHGVRLTHSRAPILLAKSTRLPNRSLCIAADAATPAAAVTDAPPAEAAPSTQLETAAAADPKQPRGDRGRSSGGRKRSREPRQDGKRKASTGRDGEGVKDVKDGKDRKKGAGSREGGNAVDGRDRAVVLERCRLLLAGEAVGLSMSPTTEDVAIGLRGLRPLSEELRAADRTLLFFPSLQRPVSTSIGEGSEQREQGQKERQGRDKKDKKSRGRGKEREQEERAQGPQRQLELALAAVPKFTPPKHDVIIRVGAKSNVGVISRTLTEALLRSSSVALHAAGPGAALVALRASVMSRRALDINQQLDLAFSLEYLKVPATNAPPKSAGSKAKAPKPTAAAAAGAEPAAAAEAAAPAADAAPAPAAEAAAPAAGTGTAADAAPAPAAEAAPAAGGLSGVTSVLQFTFYKRQLPIPEVLVSDFAPERASQSLTALLTGLLGERREVTLKLQSRDSLFAMLVLANVVRQAWSDHAASVGAFLTSLEPSPGDGSDFTATLSLRRLVGAPNFVPARGGSGRGGGRDTLPESLLGPPTGAIRWATRVEGLTGAIRQEMKAAGLISLLPEEAVCVSILLRALWRLQTSGNDADVDGGAVGAAAEAAAAAASGGGGVVPPAAAPAAMNIAILAEFQHEGALDATGEGFAARVRRRGGTAGGAGYESDAEDLGDGGAAADPRRGGRRGGSGGGRRGGGGEVASAVVLHLMDFSPVLVPTLRRQEGETFPVPDSQALAQLNRAVMLRNRLYSRRPDGKTMVMRPQLDDTGALAMRLELVPSAILAAVPEPPYNGRSAAVAARSATRGSLRRSAAAVPPPPPDDDFAGGYATDDEFGIGAEAAVLVPTAPAAAAAEAAAEAAEAERGNSQQGGGKSAWILAINSKTDSRQLAQSIVAETCKPYDRLVPVWIRMAAIRAGQQAIAALAVAAAQAQVEERAGVQLQVLPVLQRWRDEQSSRPVNDLVWRLVKTGPGAEPGGAARASAAARLAALESAAAAVALAKEKDRQRQRGDGGEGRGRRGRRAEQDAGPSAAAMAAAAAAAAKASASDGEGAVIQGGAARKMW